MQKKWPSLLLILFPLFFLEARTLYIPMNRYVRSGQRMVFNEFVHQVGTLRFDHIVYVQGKSEMERAIKNLKTGDLFITNGHSMFLSYLYANDELINKIADKQRIGARIVHDLEYMNLIEQSVYIRSDINIVSDLGIDLLVYDSEIQKFAENLKASRASSFKISFIPNPELLLQTDVAPQYLSNYRELLNKLSSHDQQKKMLIADQSIFLDNLKNDMAIIESLYKIEPSAIPIIALHPHTVLSQEEILFLKGDKSIITTMFDVRLVKLRSLLEQFENYYLFKSSVDLPTSSLIPYVDGMISVSSTVAEAAKRTGSYVFMPSTLDEINWDDILLPLKKRKTLTSKDLALKKENIFNKSKELKKFWRDYSGIKGISCRTLLYTLLETTL